MRIGSEKAKHVFASNPSISPAICVLKPGYPVEGFSHRQASILRLFPEHRFNPLTLTPPNLKEVAHTSIQHFNFLRSVGIETPAGRHFIGPAPREKGRRNVLYSHLEYIEGTTLDKLEYWNPQRYVELGKRAINGLQEYREWAQTEAAKKVLLYDISFPNQFTIGAPARESRLGIYLHDTEPHFASLGSDPDVDGIRHFENRLEAFKESVRLAS